MTTRRVQPTPIGRPPSGIPRRSRQIKIQVTEELYALVAAAAATAGRSVSDWGMRLFEREVAGQESDRPRRKRCPRCNQLLPVVDGEIEPHNEPSPPFELCSRKPRIRSTPIVRRTKP